MHVSHLLSIDAKFEAAKAMIVYCHAGPAKKLALDHFACIFHHLF